MIYDAAHAFGVEVNGNRYWRRGICLREFSCHESVQYGGGGALICHDEKTKQRIDYLRISVLRVRLQL